MLSRRSGALLLLISATIAATADDLPPEVIRLAHFKQKIRQDLAQVPNYTCLETMEREQRAPQSNVFRSLDSVRLEISNVDGKEMLAWPGAHRFEDKGLASFVTSGAIANGMFALNAHNLFVSDTAAFEYAGDEDMGGRAAVRYDYQVPEFMSGYTIRIGRTSAVVAIKGSFWFDPTSLDLLRLDVIGDSMPPVLDLAECVVKTFYARQRIGSSEALLPRRAELLLAHYSGEASHNVVEFSACHEYGSQSTISFDPPPEPSAELPKEAVPQIREVSLAAGLLVPVALETEIDSKTASVGDAVRVRVRQDVHLNGEVALPAGAIISGRIRRLDHFSDRDSYFLVGIEFSKAEWKGAKAAFLGELIDNHGQKTSRTGDIPGMGILHVPGRSFHLAPGYRMLWRTLSQPQASAFR